MKIVTISKNLFNPISLPGMGRSIELTGLPAAEMLEISNSFSQRELYVEFTEEPGDRLLVIQLWSNPHAPQITLFV